MPFVDGHYLTQCNQGGGKKSTKELFLKQLKWKLVLVIATVVLGVVYTVPSLYSTIPTWWSGLHVLPTQKIHLGLDLQGGVHLILEVQTDKAVESMVERTAEDLKDAMIKEKIRPFQIERPKSTEISVLLSSQEAVDAFGALLNKQFSGLKVDSKKTEGEQRQMTITFSDEEIEYTKEMAAKQALETIQNRIDQFGVSEPDILRQGENRILIQLPGVKDPQRAINLIGKTALLEFKLVDEEHNVDEAVKGRVPQGLELLYQEMKDPNTGAVQRVPFLVQKRTYMTGDTLTDARVSFDSQFNEPYVSLDFDKRGARLFEKITEENVKKRLAIVLDNHVYSAPVIQEKISGGQARITGNFTAEEASDLAIVLRAGSLPAPVEILEERTVGPSLGRDSIDKGMLSLIVGGAAVILFMVVYYKGSGLVANIALILNILLIAAGLAAFQATLTLPGIAGIILTIGMAVDANVIIFERVREELYLGKTPRAALDAGYEKGTLTILDANITTLIAAVVLFQFGTGPVKGFAVTLSLGILSSLFTAIIVTKLIFEYFIFQRRITRLSI
jgi:preprotein translocase subunit SecD